METNMQWLTAMTVSAAALAGCNDLADAHTTGDPLATMRGTLRLADGMDPPKGKLRLSILWQAAQQTDIDQTDPDSPCHIDDRDRLDAGPAFESKLLEQTLELETDFPAAFSVTLTEPPPAGALRPRYGAVPDSMMATGDMPSQAMMAIGDIVVYRDVNGNGRLDPSSFEQRSPDQVVSTGSGSSFYSSAPSYEVVYLTRGVEPEPRADDAGVQNSAGYYLERFAREGPYGPQYQPLDTPIELQLEATPYVQRSTCEEWCQIPTDFECPDDPADLPAADERAQPSPENDSEFGTASSYYDGSTTIAEESLCYQTEDGLHFYVWNHWSDEGCVTHATECAYEQGDLAQGVELPCKAFSRGGGVPGSWLEKHDSLTSRLSAAGRWDEAARVRLLAALAIRAPVHELQPRPVVVDRAHLHVDQAVLKADGVAHAALRSSLAPASSCASATKSRVRRSCSALA